MFLGSSHHGDIFILLLGTASAQPEKEEMYVLFILDESERFRASRLREKKLSISLKTNNTKCSIISISNMCLCKKYILYMTTIYIHI